MRGENRGEYISIAPAYFVQWLQRKQTCLAIRASLTPLHYPPTTTYMPCSTCKQSNSRCCWLVRLGEGTGFLKLEGNSHPSMPSDRASWPCQPSLGENSENIPLQGGLWCSFEQSIPKTSSVELPFSHGQSLPGQERSAADRLHMRPLYPAAALSTNSLFLLNTT